MRVLFLLNSTVMGGATISFINLIKGLNEKGINIYVVHPDKKINKDFKKEISPYVKGIYYANLQTYFHNAKPENIISRIKGVVKLTSIYQIYKHSKENNELIKIVEDVKPDLIHTNVGVIQGGHRVSKKFHIPHIWHLREYQTKDFGWVIEPSKEKFEKLIAEDYSITITEDIKKYFNLRSNRTKVIYNGCFNKYDTNLILPKEKYFLCSSRISKEKNQQEVIEAFAKFHENHPEYKLKIAGFGNEQYIQKLRKLSKEKNCQDSIEFLGFVKNIRPLMDKATALVVASKFEGFGRMTAEAAFRGCLVIGKDSGGTKEILSLTGGLLYNGGVENLRDKMNEVATYSEKEYLRKVKYAQKVAVEKFSIEQNIENTYKFYQSILKEEKNAKL